MLDKTTRAIVGFVVAPLVPTCLFLAYIDALRPKGINAAWDLIAGIFVGSLVSTYPITLIIGVPAYVLISRHQTLRLQHVLGISGAAGAAVGLLLASPPLGALLGLSAGVTFWLIWHRARDERRPF